MTHWKDSLLAAARFQFMRMSRTFELQPPGRCQRLSLMRIVLAYSIFLFNSACSADSFDSKAIDESVSQALEAWHVPGVAVAIVKDGEVIYLKGHGVKKQGRKDPITPETVFPLASCTKAFTSAAMGILVDEGKVDWDDPVHKHFPAFHLSDPLVDADVRVRDLLCHRTGVASHDFLWYRTSWDQDEAICRIAKVKLQKPFRTELQYQSIMFMVAGKIIESAAKKTWADWVRERLLVPLGMKNTYFTSGDLAKLDDVAAPHRREGDSEPGSIERYEESKPNAASSLHSSARDLAQWVLFQLGDGAWKGKRLLSKKGLDETHSAQIALRFEGMLKANNPASHLMSYGLGWLLQDFQGHTVISHAGAIDGFRAQITLVPDARLGIVLLNNLQDTRMNLALGNQILSQCLGLPQRDWNAYYLDLVKKDRESVIKRLQERIANRRSDAGPSKELKAYVGVYTEPAYGEGRVELEKDHLVWRWSTFTFPLEHFEKDTFLTAHPILGVVFISFSVNKAGQVERLSAERPLNVEWTKKDSSNPVNP